MSIFPFFRDSVLAVADNSFVSDRFTCIQLQYRIVAIRAGISYSITLISNVPSMQETAKSRKPCMFSDISSQSDWET